jgi:hypothetical protein
VPTSGGRTARRPAHQQAACSTAPQLELSGPFHTSHLVHLQVADWRDAVQNARLGPAQQRWD